MVTQVRVVRYARKLFGFDCTWHIPMTLEQLSKESLRGIRTTGLQHQDVEHFPALVDSASPIHELAVDLAEDLIEMPRAPLRPGWR